ncbi:arsenate reductase ArsC [Agarilytica rhodophyticola]|uniref:arsenate reductase ArsC n=1 Tax=Agarilytica rhodophyticola TaxID=1737490 RepID=UPI000B344A49|nr:arsenate reductase ArsC [Agarilytica rhodophyticola]
MKVLYICTHNRCRSILSEAITNHMANGKLNAASAGSQPAGEVHPLTLKYLQEKNIATANLVSQSWDQYQTIQPDIVMTVCNSAAGETCPVWFGNTIKVHWPLPDPSKVVGNEKVIRDSFFAVMETIEQRVQALLALELNKLSKQECHQALHNLIGG